MFDHSVKVPRLYKTAAKIYKDLQENKGSIKQLVYQAKHQNIKALYALVVETHKRRNEIDSLMKESKLFTNEPRLDPILARILLTELLWGKQRLAGESKPVKTILAYEQIFKAHLSDVAHNNSNENISEVQKPRYVRVNTIMLSTNETVNGFRNEDWNFIRFNDKQDYKGFIESVKTLGEYDFMVDIHIPDLLVFNPKTQFYNHSAYLEGQIILQDKASCLPAFILNPEPGSTVLDMCAAPGMKTTHLAALMKNEGTIYAVEFDLKRSRVLENMLESTSVTCAKTINRDVLTITDKECPNIEYILVDPSCSGTGIIDRLNIEEHASKNEHDRISKLAGFQTKILRHALTKFPSAKRVVYSTCSLNAEENEDVVRQVLETCTTFKLVPAKKFLNNIWLNFGSSEFGNMGSYCLYTRPETDLTNGFFIAVFERLEAGEENEFINKHALKQLKKRNKHKSSDIQNIAYDESADNFNDNDEKAIEDNLKSHSNKKKKHKKNKVYPSIGDHHEDEFSQCDNQHNNDSTTNFDEVEAVEETQKSHSQRKTIHKNNQVYPSINEPHGQDFSQNKNISDGGSEKKRKSKYKKEFAENHENIVNENEHEGLTNDSQLRSNKKKKRKLEDVTETDNYHTVNKKAKKMKKDLTRLTEGSEKTIELITDTANEGKQKKKKKKKVKKDLFSPTEITISNNDEKHDQTRENVHESEPLSLKCHKLSKKQHKQQLLNKECDNTKPNDDKSCMVDNTKKEKKRKKMHV